MFHYYDCVSAGILQTARIVSMDGIVEAQVYLILQIIAIPDTTVMVEQREKTGSHARRDTNARVVTNLSHVLPASTRTSLRNMSANRASLDITARIYLFQTIPVTNVHLDTIVRDKRSLTNNFLVR